MPNLTKNLALLIFTVITIFSCTKTQNEDYEQLKNLLVTSPKTGLDSVCSLINNNKDDNEQKRKTLELLKFEAEIMCNIKHNSDSTIKELSQFFDGNGTIGEMIESHYCVGVTYADMHNYPQAITHFNQAISIGESNNIKRTDSIFLAYTHSKLGKMNESIDLHSLSLQHTKKALIIKQNLGLDDIESYQDIANAYYANNMNDSAEYYYKKCTMDIVCNNSAKENIEAIGDQLYFFARTSNEKMAKICLNQIKSIDNDSLPTDVLSKIVQYYVFIELNTDSCVYYNTLSYEKEKEYDGKANKAKNLSILYAYLKDYENATNYAYKSFLYDDSAQTNYKIAETAAAQSQYQSQELERMRDSLHEEEILRNQYLAYGTSATMTILAILGFSLYIQGRRKNLILAEKEKIESDKKDIEERHMHLQETVEADNKLRAESAKDISSVIAHLNAVANDGRNSLTEDMYDDIFNAVDKLYPGFRNHVISYYPVIENKELVIIYLVMLGMKQANVARLFNNARSVVHRKFHRIDEKLGITISEMIDEYKKKYSCITSV